MKLNPHAKPWYPKGCNPNSPEYIPSHGALKTILEKIIPNEKTLLKAQGTTGMSPPEPNLDAIPISPDFVMLFKSNISTLNSATKH